MKTIADNIKALRKNYSLTQGQLGEIAGVTDKAVSTWENGVAVPRMAVARRISEHFGISLSEILEESDEAAVACIAETTGNHSGCSENRHAHFRRNRNAEPASQPVLQRTHKEVNISGGRIVK